MAVRPVNVEIKPKYENENIERMVRRFTKKCKKERIIEQIKDRRFYEKPSVARKKKRIRARRARLREQLKKQRAIQRRNRRNK